MLIKEKENPMETCMIMSRQHQEHLHMQQCFTRNKNIIKSIYHAKPTYKAKEIKSQYIKGKNKKIKMSYFKKILGLEQPHINYELSLLFFG